MPKKNQQEISKEKNTDLSWRAAEREYLGKNRSWQWFIIGGGVILAALALWQRNFFFAVFILLAGAMLLIFGRSRPEVIEFKLKEDGIAVGQRIFYNYDRLEGFATRERAGRLDEIILKKKTNFNPYVKIPADSQTAVKAKEFLSGKIPEIEYQESFMDILIDRLGL